ncbi:MAG: type IV toxin-antitoxin system AbiEi family antitoxin domain-containing protein [Candidatus Dormibacteria bacterium]
MAKFRVPHGFRLLRELLEGLPYGRVFTSEEAIDAGKRLGLTATHVHKLLSEMSEDGVVLTRARWGLYVMHPPFGGRDEVRPIAVAVRAAEPSAVSGQSALAHWGLIDQAPLKFDTLATPTRPSWHTGVQHRGAFTRWVWDGPAFEYRRVPQREMFGIRDVRLDSETVVPMFDPERSVLEELLMSPSTGAHILAEHRDDLDIKRLHAYAQRAGRSATELVEQTLGRELIAA